MNIHNIEHLHNAICRAVFTTKPGMNYARTILAIEKLANMVHEYSGDSEDLWCIGEDSYCDLASLLIGAYWHLGEWHSGQWSDEYRALCAVGKVYFPNYANGPEPESSESDAYDQLNQLAEMHHNV